MAKVNILLIPSNEFFYYDFDNNKSFGELKNELEEKYILRKGKYYFEMEDHILNDDIILKDVGIRDYCEINAIRNDYIKIKVKVKDIFGRKQTIKMYVLISEFKVIKANEIKEIKVCNENFLFIFYLFIYFLLLLFFI